MNVFLVLRFVCMYRNIDRIFPAIQVPIVLIQELGYDHPALRAFVK